MDETSDHASNTLPNPANLTIGDWIKWFTPAQLWAVLAAACVLVCGAFALGMYFAPLLGDASKHTKEAPSPKWTGPAEAPTEVWSGPPEVPLSDITKPGALEIAELDRKSKDVKM